MALTKITNSAIADDIGLGGNPTTSTQTAGNSTTRIATTAFVSTAVANLVDSAPETLNTLAELATSIGNNATLSSTLTTSIATKLPLAGGTLTGHLNLGDNVIAKFGLDSDLQIWHDGNDSYIKELGAGNLKILGDNVQILNAAGTENQIFSASDGSVYLYHNGSAKFETTSTGINVTGTGSMINTTAGVATALALYNNTAGANNRTSIDFYTASTKYGTIEGGYGASAPEMNFKVGNAPAQILKLTSTGIDVTGNIGVTGTVDGVDIAARDAVLTSTTTTAGAALPKAGGTLTGTLNAVAANFSSTVKVGGWLTGASNTNTLFSHTFLGTIIQTPSNTDNAAGSFFIKDSAGVTHFTLNTNTDVSTFTGNITVGGTVDGVDIAARDAVLTSTTTTAGAALPKAGGTMTGDLTVVDSGGLGITTSGYSVLSAANNARSASGSLRLGNGNGSTGFMFDYTDQGQTVATIRNQYVASTTSELTIQSPFITFDTGTSYTEAMRIDHTGNVGIGTTAPERALHVVGGIHLPNNNIISWDQADGTLRNAIYVDSGDDMIIGDTNFDDIYFSTGQKTKTVVIKQTTGNVGIGTTTPGAHLDISAAAGTTGSNAPTLRLTNSSNVDYTVGSPIGALEYYHSESSGAAFPGVAASIKAVVEVTHGHQVGLAFSTANVDTAATERMRISTSGNVGIGTTAPLSPLDVQLVSGGGRRVLVNYDDSLITIKGSNQNSNPESLRIVADTFRVSTGTSGSGAVKFAIGNDGHITVANNMYFEDNGEIRMGGGHDLRLYHDASDSYIKDVGTGNLLIQGSDIYMGNTSSNHALVIRNSGNVGIGQTAPATTLHIGDGASHYVRIENASSGDVSSGYQIYRGASTLGASLYDNPADNATTLLMAGKFNLATGGSGTDFHIDTAGNVGIGTSSPVNNSNRTTLGLQGAWGGQLDIMVGSTVHAQFGTDNFSTGSSCRVQSADNIVFKTGSSGNVSQKLNSDGYASFYRAASEYGMELKSAGSRSGLVIKKPATNSVMGSLLVLTDESYRLGTAGHYHLEMLQNGYHRKKTPQGTYFTITKNFTCTGSSVTRHVINLASEIGASTAGSLRYEVAAVGYGSGGTNGVNAKYSASGYSGHSYSGTNYGSFGAGTIQNGYKSSNATSYDAKGISYHPCINMGSYIANGEIWAYVPAGQQYGFTVSNNSSASFSMTIIITGFHT